MPRAHERSVGVASYWPYHTKRQQDAARRLAGKAVRAALKRGELIKQPCERCAPGSHRRGRKPAIEAHHDDYSQPLNVRWVCRRHHREIHRELAQRIPTPAQWQDTRQWENEAILSNCPTTCPLIRRITVDMLAAMDAAGVTQAELARRIGVSRQHVNGYFNGGIRTLKALATIADAIRCDVEIHISEQSVAKAS